MTTMVAWGTPRAAALRSRDTTLPVIRRESLRWTGGTGGRPLVVEMDAENPSDRPTRPVAARLGAALFGAFVPSQFVDAFPVPAMAPGQRVRIARQIERSTPWPTFPVQRFLQFFPAS